MDGLSFSDTPIDSGWNLYEARIYFQKFLDKPMERESRLGVRIFSMFLENSIALLKVNWCVPYIQGQKNKICCT